MTAGSRPTKRIGEESQRWGEEGRQREKQDCRTFTAVGPATCLCLEEKTAYVPLFHPRKLSAVLTRQAVHVVME